MSGLKTPFNKPLISLSRTTFHLRVKNKNNYFKLPILDGLQILDAKNHNLSFPFHTHDTFNITLVLEQIFTTKTGNRFLQAPVGSIVITNPDEVHATICDTKIGNCFFTFYISPHVLIELNNKNTVFFDNKIIHDPCLFQQLVKISQHVNTLDTEVEKELLSVLRKLVLTYSTNNYIENKNSSHFREFLENDLYEKFSLEQAAAQFGLDKYKFLRLFKTETGLTPNNYIILRRIEKCKQLLQTQGDLLDISLQLGFYDATHLCKHFKKITGISPLAYQNA